MNYFDYLRLTSKKDTKESFIAYLIDILDYTEIEAERYAKIYF